jgi:sigma-B regulation protein RsbU (phosphoserine phosphatase)
MLEAQTVMTPVERVKDAVLEKMTELQTTGQSTINKFICRSAILLIPILLLLIYSSGLMAGRLTRPIRQLEGGVREIAAGNLQRKLYLKTGDELETLAESFNQMTEELTASMERLAKTTAQKERIETELSVGTRIQTGLLPAGQNPFPKRKDFDLAAMMKPAREVGGDFYDFYFLDEHHLVITVADVFDKGVPAALFMVIAKTLIKNAALSGIFKGPGEILSNVNNELCRNNTEEMFVTVWLGIIDVSNGHMVSASGGHEYPMLCRKGEGYELIKDIHGPGLATFEDITYDEWEGELYPGDLLSLYTDGVPEATDASGELFGMERMTDALNASRSEESLKDKLQSVKQAVDAFVGDAPQFDDITMTVFEYKGDKT